MALDQDELTDLRNIYAIAVRDIQVFKRTAVFLDNRSRKILQERTAIRRGPLSIEGDEVFRDVFVILKDGEKLRVTDEPAGPWWFILREEIEEMQREHMIYVKQNVNRTSAEKKRLHIDQVEKAMEICMLHVEGDSDVELEKEPTTSSNPTTPTGTKGSVNIQG